MLFLNEITEKQFFEDLERGRKIVDSGVREHFILYDATSFTGVKQIAKTSLKEICEIFGNETLEVLRVAKDYNKGSGERNGEYVFTMRVRNIRNGDKRKMRGAIRFFPADTFVCEWTDANGNGLLIPFVQNSSGEIVFLQNIKACSKNGKTYGFTGSFPDIEAKNMIERIPDYLGNNLAAVTYKGVDIIIPIRLATGKKTFKNREKENGVKKRLIHDVKEYTRKKTKDKTTVESHVRGTSQITVKGVDVRLFANWEQAAKIIKSEKNNRSKAHQVEDGRMKDHV